MLTRDGRAPAGQIPAGGPTTRWMARTIQLLVVVAACFALIAYAVHAAALIAYPWDWSPDEGLFVDYALRAWDAPATLYGHSVVPYPACHGPLQPVLLAPLVRLFQQPISGARLLAAVWTSTIAACVYVLVRRKADWSLALASAALALACFNMTFWYMLVRVDGLMVAFWLLAAVVLLPSRLEPGSATLGWGRTAAGAALLLAAVLTKLSAVFHGAPLVLGWWLVDRRGAVRLASLVALAGLAILIALNAATGGGFLWAMSLWSLNPRNFMALREHLSFLVEQTWTILLLTAAAVFVAARAGARAHRDGAILLWLGGWAILPALSKWGAWWNYLLPLLAASVILAGRLWRDALARVRGGESLAAAATAGVAAWLAATHTFPVPTAADERTGRAFYSFVAEASRGPGARILALRPEYAYCVARQPVEVEGASFDQLARARIAGMDLIHNRLQARDYALVIAPGTLPVASFAAVLERGYVRAGRCDLRFFLGRATYMLFVPRGAALSFQPPADSRCLSFPRVPEVSSGQARQEMKVGRS